MCVTFEVVYHFKAHKKIKIDLYGLFSKLKSAHHFEKNKTCPIAKSEYTALMESYSYNLSHFCRTVAP